MSKSTSEAFLLKLADPNIELRHRVKMLDDVFCGFINHEGNEGYTQVVEEVFQRLGQTGMDETVKAKAEQLDAIMKQIENAPLRPATFIQQSEIEGSSVPHALVSMENGELAYVVSMDTQMVSKLKLGDKILLDAHGKILVHAAGNSIYNGPEARLERKVDERHIEVLTHQEERTVLLAGPELVGGIDNGKVSPGAQIVVGAGGRLAVKAMPPRDGLDYFRFLDRGPLPNVVASRDIGNPPAVIERVALHVREEMTRPELRRKFRLRPCSTHLLCGVSGTGKTMAIQAIHRLLYEIMSEITGTPMGELPPRVFRMKSSQMLSMWFGESDKNIDRLFDEVEQLADRKHNGHVLPVMVVLEEAEGLGRHRGGDSIYDRIMTVILQRMDPNREGLANKLVVFLATTNEPHLVDPAFLRRIGGSVETFGRLDQEGFVSILSKHVKDLPVKGKVIEHVTTRIFVDEPIVELAYQGHQQPVVKHRRDFLTGALIDRAVQHASSKAWEQSLVDDKATVTGPMLEHSMNQQIMSVIHQLVPENVDRYTDIPDGMRVTRVRRIPIEATEV